MEGYLGEVKYFAGAYPPKGWSYCDGQLLQIQNWAALYSVMGNQFGGDGLVSFALPDLRGRSPIGGGQGPGLSYRHPGYMGGLEHIQITEYTMPAHTHQVKCDTTTDAAGVSSDPQNKLFAKPASGSKYGTDTTGNPLMYDDMVVLNGTSFPHLNVEPFTVLHHIICVTGTYPPRN